MSLKTLGDFLANRNQPKECCFCFKTTGNPRPVPSDPMVGDLCDDCRSELLSARPDVKDPAVKAQRSTTPVDPSKAGISGWLRDTIEAAKKVSLADLHAQMNARKYSPATVSAQTARIKKAYIVEGGFVSVREAK